MPRRGCFESCHRHGPGERCHDRFIHQELSGWTPIITAGGVIAFNLLATCVCIALGVPILLASLSVVEVRQRYDDAGGFLANQTYTQASAALMATGGDGFARSVQFTIPKNMTPPIYVYYELTSYFQNHKRYVRSVVSKQVGGHNQSAGQLNQCNPEIYEGRMVNTSKIQNGVVDPCGLIAWSLFNDTLAATATAPGGSAQTISIDSEDIAWDFDKNHLYGTYEAQNFNDEARYRGGGTITQNVSQAQNLLVWMKPAAYHSFKKLYGQIDTPLTAGTNVTFNIQNRYNSYGYSGRKNIVLSTTSWVGGKNNTLGIIFIVVGCLTFVTGVAFFLTYYLNPKRRGYADEMALSWNKKPDVSAPLKR